MDFRFLSEILRQTHEQLYQSSVKAININLTIRNRLFGFYIVEFEQNGDDRAEYGKALLQNLAKNIRIKGLIASTLARCRQLYQVYPQILGTLSQEFKSMIIFIFAEIQQPLLDKKSTTIKL